ncbi:hypothetical protein RBI14_17120 [Alcaligenaceae bacterium B3P038]|nr:hypothetical protein [Alcaligenaceae bacterium B3P038]
MRDIDGHTVVVSTKVEGDRFAIFALTGKPGQQLVAWCTPFVGTFATEAEAQLMATYVLKGISHVGTDGKPFFTVC